MSNPCSIHYTYVFKIQHRTDQQTFTIIMGELLSSHWKLFFLQWGNVSVPRGNVSLSKEGMFPLTRGKCFLLPRGMISPSQEESSPFQAGNIFPSQRKCFPFPGEKISLHMGNVSQSSFSSS